MNAIILCEGTTDLIMLQFMLQFKYKWKYKGFIENSVTNMLQEKSFTRNEDSLQIKSCGGIHNIPKQLRKIQERCSFAMRQEECYQKVLVMIDNDTIESKDLFIRQVNQEIGSDFSESVMNMGALDWNIKNDVLGNITVSLLMNCIPDQHCGAIEQVMFEALQTDVIEEMLISESKQYIERMANQQSRYLQAKSRHAKASINTYFAIRFPEEKYDERARILRAFDWENNPSLSQSFRFLEEL